jgi:hypothetical protein
MDVDVAMTLGGSRHLSCFNSRQIGQSSIGIFGESSSPPHHPENWIYPTACPR